MDAIHSIIFSDLCGAMPPAAQYRASFPTGMPMPCTPRSPSPNILLPSVTTMTCTISWGQLCTIVENCPLSSREKYIPLGLLN